MKNNLSYEILRKEDLDIFFEFIQRHWKKKYIFIRDRNFFNWQFKNKKNKKYNFVIAKINHKIVGCIGFIPNSIYSTNFINNDYLWLVNWVVDKDFNFVSLKLINFLLKKIKFSFIGTIGCTDKTYKILKAFGFQTGQLLHTVKKNSNYKNFLIGNFHNDKNQININKLTYDINKFNKKLLPIFFNKIKPINSKDKKYFLNRYVNHPSYSYTLYGVWHLGTPVGFLVCRICKFKKSKSLKIIDYHGKQINLSSLFNSFNKIFDKNTYEYVDFYFFNKIKLFQNELSFKVNDQMIVPNYFEPFVKKISKLNLPIIIKIKIATPF